MWDFTSYTAHAHIIKSYRESDEVETRENYTNHEWMDVISRKAGISCDIGVYYYT